MTCADLFTLLTDYSTFFLKKSCSKLDATAKSRAEYSSAARRMSDLIDHL